MSSLEVLNFRNPLIISVRVQTSHETHQKGSLHHLFGFTLQYYTPRTQIWGLFDLRKYFMFLFRQNKNIQIAPFFLEDVTWGSNKLTCFEYYCVYTHTSAPYLLTLWVNPIYYINQHTSHKILKTSSNKKPIKTMATRLFLLLITWYCSLILHFYPRRMPSTR
jgi:hypothetical protein